MATGLFKNIKDVKVNQDFNYEGAGHYWTKFNKIKQGMTRTKETFLAIEKTVIKVLPSNESGPTHFVGEEISHYIGISGNEYFEKDVKGMVIGMFGVKSEEVTEEICESVLANEGALMAGIVAEVDNRKIATKPKPDGTTGFFTKIKYMREVPAKEVLVDLTPELVKKFFPGEYLQKSIATAK